MSEIILAGTLYWQDFTFDLVDLHPLGEEREPWMKDTDEKFKVTRAGEIFEIIVSRPFMISRRNMGEKINLEEQRIDVTKEIEYNLYT